MSVQGDDDVTQQQAALLSRALILYFDEEQTMLLSTSCALGRRQTDELAADAQIAALDVALLRQGVGHLSGNSGWDRQGDAVGNTCGQDAEYLPLDVDEGTT